MRSAENKVLAVARDPVSLSLAFFMVMTVLMTWPLVLRMGHSVAGQIGDNIYFIWLISWYEKALFQLRISPFFSPYLNFPQGWNLASTDTTPAMIAVAIPGSLLFGTTWGYNFAMIASFVVSGWGMYLWVRHLTGDNWAGLVAGTSFAFVPYRITHYLAGHLSLMGTQWLPFYFWGLYDLLRQEKFSWKPVITAAAFAGLLGWTSPYYILMAVVITAAFIFAYTIFGGWRRYGSPIFWKGLLAFGVLAALFVGLSVIPYLRLNAANQLASRSLQYVARYSASLSDFLIPSTMHFLWGKWVGEHFDRSFWIEATLYLGLITSCLALVAWLKRRQFGLSEICNISALTALAAVILALGVEPRWMGHSVAMPFGLHPPGYYLFLYLPFFDKMRVMMRFGLYAIFFIALMAGLGTYVISKSLTQKRRTLVLTGLLVLVLIDLYPGTFKTFARIDARPIDYWLASQPDPGAVAQFPFTQEADQDLIYNTLVHGKPYLGGFFNANQPEQFRRIRPVMETFPSRESVDLLRRLGVAYVVVDSSGYPDYSQVDAAIQAHGLVRLNMIDQEFVYGFPRESK